MAWLGEEYRDLEREHDAVMEMIAKGHIPPPEELYDLCQRLREWNRDQWAEKLMGYMP